ncbi:MAG: nucleoside phosphorylase [Candidatus Thioglobus sp.]|nr:nucleoside phosphorylase [Candidatus Pseudothioglobus aerophilus]
MKDRSEIVIVNERLYHLGIKKGDLAQNVFIVGDPARAIRVSKEFDTIEREISNREYLTFTGTYRGIPVSVIGTGIGTDNVEIALVEAFIAHEFDLTDNTRKSDCPPMTFIRLGTSGGVHPDIAPDTLAISSYALGLDNTGLYYDEAPVDEIVERIEIKAKQILTDAALKDSRFRGKIIPYASKASIEITEALAKQAAKHNVKFEVGITVSSPGFYGPSSRFIEGLKYTFPDIKGSLSRLEVDGLRVLNMEMESSLFFHLCGQMGYRAGTICTVISASTSSDDVVDYDAAIGNTIKIGLKTLVDLNKAS